VNGNGEEEEGTILFISVKESTVPSFYLLTSIH
jgi:hypothetical protein